MNIVPTAWRQGKAGQYEAVLPGGSFRFSMEREDLPFREICDLAIRNNRKRRFLFVSRVLGRHSPVRPEELRNTARLLAEKLRGRLKDEPVVFIGMAETATTLGQAVFREYRALGGTGLYIESTRRPTGGPRAFGFAESHSHATAHVIHLPAVEDDPLDLLKTAAQVVVVDDEATTANTAAGLVRALREWRGEAGIPFSARLAVILRWKHDSADAGDLDDIVSLAEGGFTFVPGGELPEAPAASGWIDSPEAARRGSRHGVVDPLELPEDWDVSAKPGEKILVLGNGEFGFQPLLLAEAFEANGALAWLQATTRSPILLGGAIGHSRSFDALSGEGYREFLYNVPDDHDYDRVVLCLEDPAPPADHPIHQIPRLEVRS